MRMSRKATGLSIAVALAAAAALGTPALASTQTASESAQLQALYQKAKAQGGELTVYMGGDKPGQWDSLGSAFTQQFPGIKLHLVTDLSKIHDDRIDNQLATHHLVADAAILQTTQDFDRWKKDGDLLRYKPVGWNEVFSNAKDKDGYWTGVFYGAFSYLVNNKQLPATPSDFKGTDLLKPAFKNKLILTYPNDDDAVLFGWKQIVDQYGWGYVSKLMVQNPKFIRGVPGSAAGVASGQYLATIAVGGDVRLLSDFRFGDV
jgi:ABC-type Fe3+ transport system substrate-binding protein